MSTLTPERSTVLSTLLDEVTGTEEAIKIRQDSCRIEDCVKSMALPGNFRQHFTGSKAEGLNLKGSDEDYMIDINDGLNIQVEQILDDSPETSAYNRFYLCTKHTHPGFALLRYVDQRTPHPILLFALKSSIDNHLYLSSDLVVKTCDTFMKSIGIPGNINSTNARQGPSLESWHDVQAGKNISGSDYVPSIHCNFWPDVAAEWVNRPRSHGWPAARDIASIVDFGCHLVAVGYPDSETKLIEWRLSFSIAERALVWSFNHVQMQCYAVMKIILKEYVKNKCSEENQILCSYFIKTFLFWKFETTELKFWRKDNFDECMRYLLIEFYQCLLEGKIQHYFIPKFNLLSVKLTPNAQSELLQVYGRIIQSDIGIMKMCESLRPIWKVFLQCKENQMSVLSKSRRATFLNTDKVVMNEFDKLYTHAFSDHFDTSVTLIDMFVGSKQSLYSVIPCLSDPFDHLIMGIRSIPVQTCLKVMFTDRMLAEKYIRSVLVPDLPKDDLNRLHRIAHNQSASFDISSLKIVYAIVLLNMGNYKGALCILKQVLSNIPPFVVYKPLAETTESESQYVEEFEKSGLETMQRAKRAWMFDMEFTKSESDALPLAIQIELYFSHAVYRCVRISPFICLYYLLFLCYHQLRRYRDRDRALRQLEETVNDHLKNGLRLERHHVYNIAGHCLLIAGKKNRARDMFNISHQFLTYMCESLNQYNSATWYIQNFC